MSSTQDYMKSYYLKNAERIKARVKARRWSDIEKSRERDRELRKNGSPARKARLALCQTTPDQREKSKARAKKWIAENTGRYREIQKYASARRHRLIMENSSAGERRAVKLMKAEMKSSDSIKCNWCGIEVPKESRELDHIIPLNRNGRHCPENLCFSCRKCNRSRLADEKRKSHERLLNGSPEKGR